MFSTFEICVYGFFVLYFWHAVRQHDREDWLSVLLWGVIFGLLIEYKLTSHPGAGYEYPTHSFVNVSWLFNWLPGSTENLPLSIGMGWGCIVYAAMWTAYKLSLPFYLQPIVAGFLAVNIDLSLDPIAQLCNFWRWKDSLTDSYYGVPYDNFVGWFLIVSLYTFAIASARPGIRRRGFKRGARLYRVLRLIVPPIAVLGGAIFVFGLIDDNYPHYVKDSTALVMIELVCFGLLCTRARRTPRNHSTEWPIIALPAFFHVGAAVILICQRFLAPTPPTLLTFAYPSLLVAIPAYLLVGFFGYSWPYLERIFPRTDETEIAKKAEGL
jgi:hypothetical protein